MSSTVNLSQFDEAWLNLGDTSKLQIKNPLSGRSADDIENPGRHELRLMRHPDYLSFAAKYLCNITLLPFQACLLKQLWTHAFPMFIMSRGGGKSFITALYGMLRCALIPGTKIIIAGAAFRQSKVVFEYMENIWNNAPILRSICSSSRLDGPRKDTDRWSMHINDSWAHAIPIGCLDGNTLVTTNNGIEYLQNLKNSYSTIWSNDNFEQIGYFFDNGIQDVYTVKTKTKLEFTATSNHKMQVVRNNNIEWISVDDMKVGDRIIIDRTKRWADTSSFKCSEDDAYCLGLMIGDGNYTNKYFLRYTTIDKELLSALNKTIGTFKPSIDNLHYNFYSKKLVRKWLDFWDIDLTYTINKILPKNLLNANKQCIRACLQGLFDSDGYVTCAERKGGFVSYVGFTNISKELIRQIQYILLHFGIISYVHSRNRLSPRTGNKCHTAYDLYICGPNVKRFYEEIGFRLSRKQQLLSYIINKKKRWFNIDDNVPIDKNILLDLVQKYHFGHRFNLNDIKSRKTFTHKYLEEFLKRAIDKNIVDSNLDIIKKLCNNNYYYDTIIDIQYSGQKNTYDINVPGNNTYIANGFISHNSGEKIRGLRAHTVIMDEFAAIPIDIFETVIAGFTAVSASPVENVQAMYRRDAMINAGMWSDINEERFLDKDSNQIILSGTADYDFKHFAQYWKRYKAIINSRGDPLLLKEIVGEDNLEHFNWKDYCVIRIPYELIPKGFMDDKQIIRSRATMHSGIYGMEYGAVFIKDSSGFFKRSLIESCVASEDNVKKKYWPSWCNGTFDAVLRGSSHLKYVYGIDPASENDNFSIIVLEVYEEHVRVVYCWSTNRKDFKSKLTAGLTGVHDFYGFAARKIRDLMKVFPCERIGIDAQGGGIALEESLHDPDKMEQGETPLWPVIEEKEKDTDYYSGSHILEMCQFSRAEWVADANHGLRKDLEDKVVLFPRFDPITLGLANESDKRNKDAFEQQNPGQKWDIYDSLEDCVMEIEELKNELSTIVMSKAGSGVSGRDRWDTPEVKLDNGRKGRLRKDRYSALLIANMVARTISRAPKPLGYDVIGDFTKNIRANNGQMYNGPDWFTEAMNEGIVFGVKR